MISKFYGGLSGLSLPMPKYRFPAQFQQSSRLTYYASLFNSIEINSSFYKLPLQRTVGNWTTMVPKDSRFTFKLWREISHVKALAFDEKNIVDFFNALVPAAKHKGCILIQFPPSQGSSAVLELESLLEFIRSLKSSKGWDLAVEFRNKSWYQSPALKITKKYNTAVVIHDLPKSRPPMMEHTTDVIYLRFHGPTGNYRESYSESFLEEYGGYIHEWLQEGKKVYAYFNNTMGEAFQNLKTLNEAVSERS